MEDYQRAFIDFALNKGVLKVFEHPNENRILKSGRPSPWFFNAGDFNDGESTKYVGDAIAECLVVNDMVPDVLFGPAAKGIPLAVMTARSLFDKDHNCKFAFDRKEVKDHGEVTNPNALQDAVLVGGRLKNGTSLAIVEDVLTTGDTKVEAKNLLDRMAELNYTGCVIMVDREEVDPDGTPARDKFTKKTGVKVASITNARDIYSIVQKTNPAAAARLATYLQVYGTEEARNTVGSAKFKEIINEQKSVIVACDVKKLEQLDALVAATCDNPRVSGYKTGTTLAYRYTLAATCACIRKHTNKRIIHDGQKAGTDIPAQGPEYAEVCKEAGVDAIILFPQAGPETERGYIYGALDNDLGVIVGGRMTQPAYTISEGGWIGDKQAIEMYTLAARLGVQDFVVPGNKLEVIAMIKAAIEAEGVKPRFYSPGFGFMKQGGKIEDAVKVAGDNLHAIVGTAIYGAADKKAAAEEMTSKLGR
jgi:orotidine-5'-phosphate decarboxylase